MHAIEHISGFIE